MGKAVGMGGTQPGQGEEFHHFLPPLLPASLPVDIQRLPDDLGHFETGVEGGPGVLEDDLDPLVDLLELAAIQRLNILPFETDLSRRQIIDPQDEAGDRGLPAAALPHEAEAFSPTDMERNSIHGADRRRHAPEDHLQQTLMVEEIFFSPLNF